MKSKTKKVKTYVIGIPLHSYITVEIKAKTEDEACEKARAYEPSDREILESLESDGCVDILEVKED